MIRTVIRNGRELYVRPLRLADTDRLLAFLTGLGPESRSFFRPHAFSRDDAERATRDAENGRSLRLVIVDPAEECVVGYAYFSESGAGDARFPMVGIAVTDAYQNQGLGRLLMDALIEEARAQGRAGLQLTVYKENARALHLYTSLGFRLVGDADGGKQHAMRLEFPCGEWSCTQRGILLNPLPWGLAGLTVDTWGGLEWVAYLDFLSAAGANLVVVMVWPGQYHHPDEPATLPNAWRISVLRQALQHARGLGMKACVGFLMNGVPPSVWLRYPERRAAEVTWRGVGLCWRRGRQEIAPFPIFLFDALADVTDAFVMSVAGPALCTCIECRDYARVVQEALDAHEGWLAGRCALHPSLSAAEQLDSRLGLGASAALVSALSGARFSLVDAEALQLRNLLAEKGVPALLCDARLDAGGEAAAVVPRPRLRQVDRLVAQNLETMGVVVQRTVPATQFATDFVLLRRLLFPARASHDVLRELGRQLYSDRVHASGFARAVWSLDAWWESGRAGDLRDARDGLAGLPADPLGWVGALADAVHILYELVYYLESGERQFDALVTRVHARMVESPAFRAYTLDRVWQTRARAAVTGCVADWLAVLREHRAQSAL